MWTVFEVFYFYLPQQTDNISVTKKVEVLSVSREQTLVKLLSGCFCSVIVRLG